MVGAVPFRNPEVGQVAPDRLAKFNKKGAEMATQLEGIVAPLSFEGQRA